MSTTTDQRDELAKALKEAINYLHDYKNFIEKSLDGSLSLQGDERRTVQNIEYFIEKWKY